MIELAADIVKARLEAAEQFHAADRAKRAAKKSNPRAYRKPEKTYRNRAWWGWNKYVIPATPFALWLETQKEAVQAELEPVFRANDGQISLGGSSEGGWKDFLAHRMSLILGNTPEAVCRRLYDIFSGRQLVVSTEYADAACLSLGLYLDRDVVFPILPGSKKIARELLTERATVLNVELDDVELQRYVNLTCRLSALILYYPHKAERLQDLAPLDCLRPMP